MVLKVRSLVTAVAAATVLHAGSALAADGLKLGALLPLTGGLGVYGKVSDNGIKLAVEEANAAGGVNGGKVDVVTADTQATGTAAVDAAQKLVNVNKVSAIVGALSSAATIPVAESVTSVAGVPQVSNASTATKISTLKDNDFLFRTVPSDGYQSVALAGILMEQGIKDIAVVYINNDYGKGLADAFDIAFKKLGGKVTASVGYEEKQPSYRGELANAAKGGSEHLLLIAYPDNGGTDILKQSLEGGYFGKFVYTDGMKAQEIIDNIGAEYLEGGIGTTSTSLGGKGKDMYEALYTAKFGAIPEKPYSDSAYDAAMILMLAAEKAKSTDPKAIRDAIRDVANAPGEKVYPGEFAKAKELLAAGKDIDYVGAAGSMDMDANGDALGAVYSHWMIKGGKYVDVKTVSVE